MPRDHVADLAAQLREQLIERRRSDAAAGRPWVAVEELTRSIVEAEAAILSATTRDELVRRVLRDTVGLGPLEELMDDPAVEEVMVNGPDRVYLARAGRIESAPVGFAGEQELRDAIERILAPLGRRVDESSPMVDARLADGSRVHVVIPPLAVDGPSMTIRRFTSMRRGAEGLVEAGTLSKAQMRRLASAVRKRRTILVSGGTGSGKTTMLNALSAFCDPDERIVTIEDAAELRLSQPHVVRLESRPPSIEGRGQVTIRDLVRGALRMRPDRVIVGEVRGAEALDLLVALNTGHRGSLSTIHANSVDDALARLQTLCLMADVGLPADAVAEQIRRAIDVGVHLERLPDGSRRMIELRELGSPV